jgi:hypothetical protein
MEMEQRVAGLERVISADAVAQTVCLLFRGLAACGLRLRPADCQSAKQQAASLRYEKCALTPAAL